MDIEDNKKVRILLVEDDALNVELVREMLLNSPGFAFLIEAAGCLAAAEASLEAHDFDIVLLDLGLPDGQELNAFSRIYYASPNIPIVAITALDDEVMKNKFVEQGLQDYLVKGTFDSRLLVQTIRKAIEHKKAEIKGAVSAETRARIAQLEESEKRYRVIFEDSAVAITVVDVQERIVSWNKFAEQLFGAGVQDFYLKPVNTLYPKEEWEKIRSMGIRKTGAIRHLETAMLKNDGSLFDAKISISVLTNTAGQVTGSIGVIWDISERKKAERQLNIANQQLLDSQKNLENANAQLREATVQLAQAEKLGAIGQLASGVAHEVRNPLGIIAQCVAYLEKTISSSEEFSRETLTMIKDSTKRADKIIASLLDFSRAARLDLQEEDINVILENSLALVRPEFPDIHFVTEVQENLPAVPVDKNKIEQVFINVLTNAVHAMQMKGKLVIRTYVKQFEAHQPGVGRRRGDIFKIGDKVVVAEIEDEGEGIPEENLGRIWDPFFTTKREGAGTGLGLSVSRNIITLHKGLIDIKSQVGKGTKVFIMFRMTGGGNG